jgi:hypothetical protein
MQLIISYLSTDDGSGAGKKGEKRGIKNDGLSHDVIENKGKQK